MTTDNTPIRFSGKRIRAFNKRVTNPILRTFALSSRGPFAILRHVGRRSGKPYETTIMVWPLGDTFVIAQTYGSDVDWYRNMLAASGGTLRYHKREYTLGKPEPIDAQTGLLAFPAYFKPILKLVIRLRGAIPFVQMQAAETPA
ncbi:MAG: nitroreductase family deazaflavin-dependent oxidoreductase [Ktedonobacterales bacterium]